MKIKKLKFKWSWVIDIALLIARLFKKKDPMKPLPPKITKEDMWKQIRYFTPAEFDSPDKPGSGMDMNFELILKLDYIRHKLGCPLIVTSGMRTPKYNKQLKARKYKAAKDSSHLVGLAVDLAIRSPKEMYDVVDAAMGQGITRIFISTKMNYVHMDLDMQKTQGLWGR